MVLASLSLTFTSLLNTASSAAISANSPMRRAASQISGWRQ